MSNGSLDVQGSIEANVGSKYFELNCLAFGWVVPGRDVEVIIPRACVPSVQGCRDTLPGLKPHIRRTGRWAARA